MIWTKNFRSNKSQAVRLPKAVEFPDSVREVSIVVQGVSRIVAPADLVWDNWFDAPAVSADFMENREQPVQEDRDRL